MWDKNVDIYVYWYWGMKIFKYINKVDLIKIYNGLFLKDWYFFDYEDGFLVCGYLDYNILNIFLVYFDINYFFVKFVNIVEILDFIVYIFV